MKKRELGNTNLNVSPIAFGCNAFGWTVNDEHTAFELLDAFFDAGGNFIDTADIYPSWGTGNKSGESERIIGKWMKARGKRSESVVLTKVGGRVGDHEGGLGEAYIIKSVENSLHNLQTDYIDLYLSHIDDIKTPFEDVLTTYEMLIQQGKIRAIGASNYKATRLSEALRISKESSLPCYKILETRYNLYDRDGYEKELESICQASSLGMISYSSLASGFLTGKYRSEADVAKSMRGTEVIKRYMNDRGLRILRELDEVASEYNSNPSAISLAWLIAQPSVNVSIISANKVGQLTSLLECIKLELDPRAIERLTVASAS